MQHIEASKELSYTTEMSDLVYRKWNPSAYHGNNKGNLVIDRKLKVGLDVSWGFCCCKSLLVLFFLFVL